MACELRTVTQGERLEFYIVRKDGDGVEINMAGYQFQGEIETPEGVNVAALTCTLDASPLSGDPDTACRVVLPPATSILIPVRRGYVFDVFAKPSGGDPEFLYRSTLDVLAKVTEWTP